MAIKIKRRVAPLDEKQKRQRQVVIITVFVAVALFFVGFQMGKNTVSPDIKVDAKQSEDNTFKLGSAKTGTQISNLGPKKFDLAIPTGFVRSEDGAKKAAATYIESWPQLLSSPDFDVATAIDYVTTSNSTELRLSLATTITDVRARFADAAADQYYHQSVPLKIKVNSSDSTNVSLSVWSMELWVGAGTLEPQATFDIQDIELVYENKDWKIDTWVTTPGPTPEWAYRDNPLNSLDFMGALAQYEEYKR